MRCLPANRSPNEILKTSEIKKGGLMTRKETTAFLSRLLERDKLKGMGKYWAKEVTLDYGKSEMVDDTIKSKTRRIDYLQFIPKNQLSVSGLEKGEFVCYEVKSCKEDFLSGHGQNFIAEKNYLVMTMETYKDLESAGEIQKLPYNIGILIAMPLFKKYRDDKFKTEYDDPTQYKDFDDIDCWYLDTIKKSHSKNREKSITELLFCMVRSLNTLIND